jgi:hypothetical protein
MTVATAVWWGAVANAAPWFFTGAPVGSAASPLDPKLVLAAGLMLCASGLAAAGALTATRSARRLGRDPDGAGTSPSAFQPSRRP